jgi:hypothetical protein
LLRDDCDLRLENLQTTSKSFLTASRQASTEAFIKLAFAVGVFVLCLEVGYLLLSPLPFDPLGYAFNYDRVIRLIGRSGNDIWGYALMLGVWATPFLTVALGIWHIPRAVRDDLWLRRQTGLADLAGQGAKMAVRVSWSSRELFSPVLRTGASN